jgi:hypothetical protein
MVDILGGDVVFLGRRGVILDPLPNASRNFFYLELDVKEVGVVLTDFRRISPRKKTHRKKLPL